MTFIERFPALVTAGFLSLVVSLPGCATGESNPASPETAPKTGGTLVYGLTLAPSGIDPHVNASSELGIPLSNVYDTLVVRAPKAVLGSEGLFVPGLAESWEISSDGMTYTFHLRQDVTFHDGTPFNAQAVKVNLDRIRAPETKSQKAVYLLGPLQAVDATDDHEVTLRLSSPYAPLLDGLAQVFTGMASPTALAKWGADYQFHQIGTGSFRFVEYVPNDHVTIERYDAYRWPSNLFDHTGPAYLDRVEFRFFPDPAGRALVLEAGDVQVMGEVPPRDADRLEKTGRFRVLPVPVPGQSLAFLLNTQRPPVDDVRVRQALVLATDRQTIVNLVFGQHSLVADGPLTRATFGYAPGDSSQERDPETAGLLLQEAGWVDADGDGVRERDGVPLSVDVVVMSWGSLPEVAQLLQSQWAKIGVSCSLSTMTYPAALEAVNAGRYHLAPQAYAGTDPDLLWTYFHSQSPYNWSRVEDYLLDDLLDEGRRNTTSQDRLDMYAKVQARIRDLALLVAVREPVNLNVAGSRVHGLRFDAHGWYPLLHDVYLD